MQHSAYIPHTTVDDILAAYERERVHSGADDGSMGSPHAPIFTLYVLNLEPPANMDYLYTFEEKPELVAAGNWSEFRSCPGAVFASDQRPPGPLAVSSSFAWVDLAAMPNSYGPLRGGAGQVFPHSLPHAASFQPSAVHTAILPELAALAASAAHHLVWPPLQHERMALPRLANGPAGDTLEIQVVHIHDTLGIPPQNIHVDVIQDKLSSLLSSVNLKVHITESYLSFAVCDLCVNAYTNALRVRTQRQEGSTVQATAGQVLDRLLLHQSLQEYAEVILAYAGVHETRRVLPVFVLDLSLREDALLLDGAMQAAAFPDMVVAVASRADRVRLRFSCGHMPRSVYPGDVTREVLGAILTTAFGVAPTAARYHPASGLGWSYLWSLGATPFGPLSSMQAVSGSVAEAVGRNLAVVELDHQAGRIAAVLRALSRLSPKGDWKQAVPRKDVRARMWARINLATLKLELVQAALSQGRNGDALRIARLMGHDAAAIERSALQLESALVAKYECRGGTDWMALVWPPAASMVAVVAALWWRSRGERKRADARYDKIY
ncbi:hypothetical protein HYH03_017819 [Edaphochlamys debaryana]|uniref:DUF7906 domain-containing protein n=1 Tax=Edaphochlamys debaryana TaxID=47281 RepID=A0A835XFW9_9CHLO|nr:hypothetical protein HYH03_017819 [Edaphochlamys debaryana]|eukprot:KAG2483318.1 hypothetical protein HYH03_017819 [Edaphochlamys debaryana]